MPHPPFIQRFRLSLIHQPFIHPFVFCLSLIYNCFSFMFFFSPSNHLFSGIKHFTSSSIFCSSFHISFIYFIFAYSSSIWHHCHSFFSFMVQYDGSNDDLDWRIDFKYPNFMCIIKYLQFKLIRSCSIEWKCLRLSNFNLRLDLKTLFFEILTYFNRSGGKF